ncbi:MAG: IS30 family transposase [Steroidobacteraceae bacterium]
MARAGLSEAVRAELWRRWGAGATLTEIGRGLGYSVSAIAGELRRRGGFAPPARRRAPQQLRAEEREEISRALASACSLRHIARRLGRSPSTMSREVRRHGGRMAYRAEAAEAGAWARARRPKRCKLEHRRLCRAVAGKLSSNWSPEQIAGWLKRRYPGQTLMQASHETLYRSLFIQARGLLKQELLRHLRGGHRYRRGRRTARVERQSLGPIPDAISIRERPAEASDRAVPGHWEGDLIAGRNNTHIATLVERHSRYLLLVKVPERSAETVAKALAVKIRRLPLELRRSLTWDRGSEMAAHRDFSLATDMQVYFCDPQSPWQRGSNENTNGLLRQYFPKGTDLAQHSQRHLNAVAKQMNQRPRKTLGFKDPAETLAEVLR